MDYKYIEQLLERYWNGETSVEEEQILRSFFSQKEIPAHLLRYKAWFAWQVAEKGRGLGDDFDAKVLAQVEQPVVRARRLTLRTRCIPLFKAVAMVAVLFLVGTVARRSLDNEDSVTMQVQDEYRDRATDSQVAYGTALPLDTVAKAGVDEAVAGKTNLK